MTSIDVPIRAFSDAEHSAHLRRAMIASTVGTTIEWYDFLLYGQVTALVFGKLFFPKSDPLVGVLEAFAVFFVGFVGRPIGAAIFGHWGDRIGRKATLIATLLVSGIATVAVGLVPTYASIGIWGAVLLTAIRLIQGIGVGGEWGGSVLLAMEWARTNKHRGFIASWPQFGAPAGFFLANLAVLVFSWLSGDQFLVWGWRIPFLISIVMVGIGLWIRLGILENPGFPESNRRRAHRTRAGARSAQASAQAGRADCALAAARAGAGLYLRRFRLHLWHDGPRRLAGFPVDRRTRLSRPRLPLGHRRRASVGPHRPQAHVYHRLRLRRRVRLRLLCHAGYESPGIDLYRRGVVGLADHDDVRPRGCSNRRILHRAAVRYSGSSLGYQLASIIAGGPSPFIATALFAAFASSLPIALYILGCAVVGIVATALLMDYTNRDISEEYDKIQPARAAAN